MRRLIAPSLVVCCSARRSRSRSDTPIRMDVCAWPLSSSPSPTGTSSGPNTVADGGIQQVLAGMGAVVRVEEAANAG